MHEQHHAKRHHHGEQIRPGATEAARAHWQTLAGPAGLHAEFASNYLGCWPSNQDFAGEFAQLLGHQTPIRDGWAEQLATDLELAFVPDKHGTHVFVHPSGGPALPEPEPTVAPVRHLRLVPDRTRSRQRPPGAECPS